MSSDKISAFCDHIKKKAIEPAHKDAKLMLEKAREEASKILFEAKAKADEIVSAAHQKHDEILSKAKSEAEAAANLVIARLKNDIEEKIFKTGFENALKNHYKKSEFLMPIVESISKHIEKNGLGNEVSVVLSSTDAIDKIRDAIVGITVESLERTDLNVGSMLKDKDKIFIDVSEKSLAQVFWSLIKKEIRKTIFGI